MYLEHFNLSSLPFTLTPNTNFYCELPGHQETFNTLLISVRNGEGFIKVVAEVGAGKTILCRKLINALDENFVTAFIPNPDLTPLGLRKALAAELHINYPADIDQHRLLELVYQRLLEYHQQHKQVVLCIDEAQALSDECLEAVRLLTNLETESKKLLQVILFGQPELDYKLKKKSLRQLQQRITFSCHVPAMAKSDLSCYLSHRLSVAGYTYGNLFSPQACKLLYRASGGMPRVVNILCHKALMVAYGRGEKTVGKQALQTAIRDTEWIACTTRPYAWALASSIAGATAAIFGCHFFGAF